MSDKGARGKTIKLLVNLYHHYPGEKQTKKYSIPFKKRTKRVTDKEVASGIYEQEDGNAVEGLQFVKDNYDKLREIFDAGDEMLPVKQAMGVFLKRFFKNPEYKRMFVRNKNMASGFDNKRYNSNRGGWSDKPINEFKKLFD
jgi:hypothetical protein